jgi:hypothetical protein
MPASAAAALSARGGPTFHRGRFIAALNGHTLEFALMPPYLNLLRFSETYLESRPGWKLTRDAIRSMRDDSRQAGAEFVVMFLPFKSQIVLPSLAKLYSRDELAAAFRAYLPGVPPPPPVETMAANRLAQNAMMRRLCDELAIPLLDLTSALQARFEQGENVYFPDDSHINEAGHAVVAQALAAFLAETSKQAAR